jgi:hypothetical protein
MLRASLLEFDSRLIQNVFSPAVVHLVSYPMEIGASVFTGKAAENWTIDLLAQWLRMRGATPQRLHTPLWRGASFSTENLRPVPLFLPVTDTTWIKIYLALL